MDSLAMNFLAELIYDKQDNADFFRSLQEVEKLLGENIRKINLKEKYVAIYKKDGMMQIKSFDQIRTSSKIGSDALILKTNLLERKLYEKTECGLFQYAE